MRSFFTILALLIGTISMAQINISDDIDLLLSDSKFEEAIQKIDSYKAPDTDTEINFQIKKSEALARLGKFNEANQILEYCATNVNQSKNKNIQMAQVKAAAGYLQLNQGRYDLALQLLSEAIQELPTNSLELAQVLSYLGQVYVFSGKYKQAEEQLQITLSIRQQKLPETHELIAASYNDLGLVYSQLDADKAFEYYEKASALYEKLHGQQHPKSAIANTNLGVLHLSEKLYGDAITYFESALNIWEKLYPTPHPNKALVLMNLGSAYAGMGNKTTAATYYEKALTMYESSQGTKHPDVAFAHNLIGNLKVSDDKFNEALRHYQKAFTANVYNFNSDEVTKNPGIKNFYNGKVLLYSLMYKAEALETRHFRKTLKQGDLDLCLKTLQACDSLIDRLRQQTGNEADKLSLGALANDIYAQGVRVAFTLSEIALNNRKTYRELSFYFAEKSKAAVLLDAISDTNAKSYAGIPDNLLENEKQLKASLAQVTQKLAEKPTETEERRLREQAFIINQQYTAFIHELENQYPQYFNLKYNVAAPSVKQLQNILGTKTALVTYFIDEKRSHIYTYVITKNNYQVTESAIPENFDRYITGLRNSLYYIEPNAFKLAARRLGQLLIPKLNSSVTDILIIPTGRLSVIPFETLLTKKVGQKNDYSALPYLLKKYSVRYEFSAGLLLQKKHTNTTITSALLCAPVTFTDNRLIPLPGTETEVNTIAALFNERNISNQIKLKEQATETSLKSKSIKDFSLLHFATHGIVDETNPELSRIYLQASETEDGNLFSGEIYNMELMASLVTLSACETGLGKVSKGEGVIGLARALVYAGAQNLIVSFWSVADESTAQLMTEFYKQLLNTKGSSISEQLRQTKLTMLKGTYSAPYYWAPFILIGY
jgi:CHAT domain-containing protein/uncharacterized protein HemY